MTLDGGSEPTKAWYEKYGLALKDVVTISLATLAFLVSASTAYFNWVRVSEDVSVIINRVPVVVRNVPNYDLLVLRYETDVVLINSGNKPAVVMSASLLILKKHDQWSPCFWPKEGRDVSDFHMSLAPVLIKPGDALPLKIKLERPGYLNTSKEGPKEGALAGAMELAWGDATKKLNPLQLQTCMEFQLASASGTHRKTVPMVASSIPVQGLLTIIPGSVRHGAQNILERSGTIFWH
jgi:hypothetical protein